MVFTTIDVRLLHKCTVMKSVHGHIDGLLKTVAGNSMHEKPCKPIHPGNLCHFPDYVIIISTIILSVC